MTEPDILYTNQMAVGLSTREVPIVSPDSTIREIQQILVSRAFECASHIVICSGTNFMGLIRIEDLYQADETLSAKDLMDAEPPLIKPGISQEIAAWTAVRHKESAIAVVNQQNKFIGLIPPFVLLQVLLEEHEEDLSYNQRIHSRFNQGKSSITGTHLKPVLASTAMAFIGAFGCISSC